MLRKLATGIAAGWVVLTGLVLLLLAIGFAVAPDAYPVSHVGEAMATDIVLMSPALRYLQRRVVR